MLALVACSGGGGTSTPSGTPASGATGTAQFAFTFYDPALSAHARSAKFASRQTASITIAVNGARDPLLFNVGSGAASCNPAGTVCGISVTAPAGNDTFTITLYDDNFAKGSVLGMQTVTATIAPGVKQQIPLSIAAVPFAISLRFAPGASVTKGIPGSIPLTLTAYDEGGTPIIGSYLSPIPLALIDPSGSTTLSSATVASSTQVLTLNYNGNPSFTRAQIQSTLQPGTVQARDTVFATTPSLIYVSSPASNAVYAYPLAGKGATPPTLTLAGPTTQLSNPEGIAFDAAGSMYVLNAPSGAAHAITVYARDATGDVAPLRVIAGAKTLLDAAYGDIAFDAVGNIVVHTARAVLRFNAGASGNVAPASLITGINPPIANGFAFDPAGNLYVIGAATVPTDTTGNVLVFASGAKGAATPIRSIGGSSTGIINALGVRLDAAGNAYVLNNDVNRTVWPEASTITMFPAGSQGNVAPASALTGPDTSLGGAQAFALDTGGFMYVVAPLGNSRIVTHTVTASANARPFQVLLDTSFFFAPGAISPIAALVR